jgi:iron complex transport system ATP-binding protein
LEELPGTTSHALLIADGRTVAAGPAAEVINSESISAAFRHPIEVEYRHGRWSARVDRVPGAAVRGEAEKAAVPA